MIGALSLHFTFSLGRITKEPRNQERKIERLVEFVVIGDGVTVLDVARQIAM